MIHSRTGNKCARIGTGVLAIMIVGVSLYGPLSLIPTAKTQAQFGGPAFEVNPVVVGGVAATAAASTITAANTTAQSLAIAPKNILDALAWMLAKTVIQSLTRSIVNWINSGFQGSPAFITDLGRNLGNLADAVADDFIRGLDDVVISNTGFSIRAPFQDQIARKLREEFYRTTSSYGFDVRYPYRDCYRGQGFSMSGFLCESQNPANNVYGRYQLARNELFRQLDTEAQTRLQELSWGKGFLSWRGPCGPNANPAAAAAATHEGIHLGQKKTTRGCPIRTPGAVIENALGITTTSPFRQLELADSVNEIVLALMSQMVNQVLGGTGLSGVSSPSSGGGPSYLTQATDPSQYNSTLARFAEGFSSVNIEEQRRGVMEYRSVWERIANAANSAKEACSIRGSQEQADTVLTRANANISRANAALVALENIQGKMVAAQNTTGNRVDAVNSVVLEWNTLLGSNQTIPSQQELQEAKTESQDTGNTEPGSLYSQMMRLSASCGWRL